MTFPHLFSNLSYDRDLMAAPFSFSASFLSRILKRRMSGRRLNLRARIIVELATSFINISILDSVSRCGKNQHFAVVLNIIW